MKTLFLIAAGAALAGAPAHTRAQESPGTAAAPIAQWVSFGTFDPPGADLRPCR